MYHISIYYTNGVEDHFESVEVLQSAEVHLFVFKLGNSIYYIPFASVQKVILMPVK